MNHESVMTAVRISPLPDLGKIILKVISDQIKIIFSKKDADCCSATRARKNKMI
jgi:hypothetical protein